MEEKRKRHCWECRRRCLVCDSTVPACKRCSRSGTTCPGYSHVKPTRLRWLAPGKVRARPRKLEKTPSSENNRDCNRTTLGITAEPAHGPNYGEVPRLEIIETCVVVQAAEYFNACIYPDLVPIQELGQNPHIFPIMPAHVRRAIMSPEYLQSVMICMTLSHRINRTGNDRGLMAALVEKFYRYRGNVIRSLSQQLDARNEPPADIVIAGALMLLLVDVQHNTSLNWRWHLEGIQKMIKLRGGFSALTGSRSLDALLISCWFVAVFGNTTCPTSDLTMTESHLSSLDSILNQYGTAVSPFHLCPLPLFAEIIKINDLRKRGAKYGPNGAGKLSQEAYGILRRIQHFSSEQWAKSKPSSRQVWTLTGHTYQVATDLYCILSLQSLPILPATPALISQCTADGQRLQGLLQEALSLPQIQRFMLWPLVLLGVEAVNGDTAMRAFVTKQLLELSCHVGTYAPLTAKSVLESFWASGEVRWDTCFKKSYVFTMQIAVDTSQIARSF